MNTEQKLLDLFAAEFKTGRLANVKFFVKRGRASYEDLVEDVHRFETAKCAPVENVDRDIKTVRFDEAFA